MNLAVDNDAIGQYDKTTCEHGHESLQGSRHSHCIHISIRIFHSHDFPLALFYCMVRVTQCPSTEAAPIPLLLHQHLEAHLLKPLLQQDLLHLSMAFGYGQVKRRPSVIILEVLVCSRSQ